MLLALSRNALKIILCLTLVFGFSAVSFAQEDINFDDVPESHENYNAVRLLSKLGIIKGYDDGTFKPEKSINRVEALKILLEGAKVAIDNSEDAKALFSDTGVKEWYYKYVKTGKALAVIKGNPDGTFAPARQVNKVEFLKMMLLTYKIDPTPYETGDIPFTDTNDGEWYLPYMRYAKQFNIVSPDENGKGQPGKLLTRGEASEILYRLLLIDRGGDVQKLLSESEALLVDALIDVQQKKYSSAQLKVFKAVDKTKEASEKTDKVIAQAAYLVAQSLEKTIRSYLLGLEGKADEARTEAEESISLADQAEQKAANVIPITSQIKSFATKIMEQLP